jgi:3-methyladenine DNA glycosylase/8-oxoguanine DNA glycosylase
LDTVTATAVAEQRIWRPGWPCDPADILRPLRRGPLDPSLQYDRDGTVWRASMTPTGPATLRISARRSWGEVELQAWGPGGGWMLEQAPELLGAADRDADRFESDLPRVRRAWARNPHWRVARSGLVLEALVAAVIEQKVTGQEAWLGWRRLLRRFGETAPGPAADRKMRCLPTADALSRIPSREWLRCSSDGARSQTITRAGRVAAGLERTLAMSSPSADAALRSVPGVGVWTSAEVRQRAHGDADAVSFGDYHVATHIGWAITGAPITDDELRSLLECDRPHRYRVQHVVVTRLAGPPRRGPRMPPRRHLPA